MSERLYRFRVLETRKYEFDVWAEDEDAARNKGIAIWRAAPTVGQWEVDATEYDYVIPALYR